MISRRILAAVVLLWALPCLAQTGGVKTPSQLNSEINSTYPDNTSGAILPTNLRQVSLDQVASVPFLNFANTFLQLQTFNLGITVAGTFTAPGLVTNADLANPATTVNGVSCTLGGTCTVTATATQALTFGTHLTAGGSSYNGGTAVTISSDCTNANTASTMVCRDSSGNFSAGTITASLTGGASLDLPLSALGTGVQTALGVNIGTAGSPVLNGGALGSPSSAGAIPAYTLGGTVSGGGNQINNVVVGATSPGAITGTVVKGQAGNGAGVIRDAGLLTAQLTATGNGADTTEDVLQTFSFPANTFDAVGRCVRIDAYGSFAANADTKTVRLYFGVLAYTSTGLTVSGLGWNAWSIICKTGSNTQSAIGSGTMGNTVPSTNSTNPNQTDTSAITIKVTGQAGTANANDIVAQGMLVTMLN